MLRKNILKFQKKDCEQKCMLLGIGYMAFHQKPLL